jgi:two-component system, chemotaxis family, CheB/CheR fusion protein
MPRKRSDGVPKKRTTPRVPKAGKPTSKEKDLAVPDTKTPFPIVGIGASAGGLEAFERFFTHTPPDTGMAFVLVRHLDPKHKSILSELVRRYTKLTVHEVEDGMMVEPNTFCVIPMNRNPALLHGNLHLLEPSEIPAVLTRLRVEENLRG